MPDVIGATRISPILVPDVRIGWNELGTARTIAAGLKSSDCGPGGASSVVIKDVEGEGADAATAMKNAHQAAKALGQASCDGGTCTGATVCKYVEDNWTASAPTKNAQNVFVSKGTTSGHCSCE